MNRVTVLKFGGTSIQDAAAIRRVTDIVAGRKNETLVALFSALNQATNTLIRVAKKSALGDIETARRLLDGLLSRHTSLINEVIINPSSRSRLLEKTTDYFHEAKNLATGLSLTREFSLRSLDYIVGFGELASSGILTASLQERGIPAQWVNAREWMVTNDDFGHAHPDIKILPRRAQELFFPILEQGIIPITQGFIGATEENGQYTPTTLGLEGSDYSAALLSYALDAQHVEIWTDVDGILTSDPRIVSKSQPIACLSYEEAAQLTLFGLKALHPSTLLPVSEKRIPLRVRNSFRAKSPGTWILPHEQIKETPAQSIKSITCKKNVTRITVHAPPHHVPISFFGSIYELFNKFDVTIDLVTTAHRHISMAFTETEETAHMLRELEIFSPFVMQRNKAIVTLVGDLASQPGSLFEAIFRQVSEDRISMICYGASDNSLSFLTCRDQADSILRNLHRHFFETAEEIPQEVKS
ncbi:MAG: hypothetical protein B6244_11575 [Candidatus Cloacimonetes bacterium 4572_55]|nr:MAG: hypothetical protein B6244_11575 [Candidatus Cloacimonetes bacterium 4572_55]